MMNQEVLQVQGLTTRRGDFQLGPLAFSVASGSCLAIQGINGAGKTTLLEAIAGFSPAQAGCLMLQGRDITAEAPELRRIAYVPQDLALFPHLTVEGNVAFGLRDGRRASRGVLKRLLDEFKLNHLRTSYPQQLSRGQRQRVALARALAMEPSLVLFDEPSVNLDATSCEALHLGVRRLVQEYDLAVLYVTHHQSEVARLADHVAILSDGRLLQTGSYSEVHARPADTCVASHLGIDNLWSASIVGKSARGLRIDVDGHILESSTAIPPRGPFCVGLSAGDIEIARSRPQGINNCLEVSVVAIEHSGPLLALQLDGSPRLRAWVPAWWAKELQIGTRLWARLPPEALRLIPDSSNTLALRPE
ncbi:MAG: ABC transporter ATP-binding protein [Gammaproteobacteria bacterium]|jgi:ABC-type sulfate/molybdate transport systems ATPase subunit